MTCSTKGGRTWFKGVDVPNLTAFKVVPIHSHYWDPKSNKILTPMKMGLGALTGRVADLMDQGEVKV